MIVTLGNWAKTHYMLGNSRSAIVNIRHVGNQGLRAFFVKDPDPLLLRSQILLTLGISGVTSTLIANTSPTSPAQQQQQQDHHGPFTSCGN